MSNHFIVHIGTNNLSSNQTTERTRNTDNSNLNENSQLLTEGFSTPYKLDYNLNGAGILYMSKIISLLYLLKQRTNQ